MMRAGDALGAMRALPVRGFAEALAGTGVLVLAPHPDDESLGCGGLIAEVAARGVPLVIVILTDGSMSHPHSVAFAAPRLRDVREREAIAAAAVLGVPASNVVFLRYPDTGAPGAGPALNVAVARVCAIMAERNCDIIVGPWRHDPHCDHKAAAAIASVASAEAGARLLSYPVWGWTLPPEREIDAGPLSGFRLEVGHHIERKRAAILAHASQYAGLVADDPSGFQMTPSFIDLFLTGTETYLEAET